VPGFGNCAAICCLVHADWFVLIICMRLGGCKMFRYSGCGCLVAQIALQDWQCGVEWWDEVPV
jgi:hypothetical protein